MKKINNQKSKIVKMSKKDKQKYVDDGHTIYDMNVDAKWNSQQKRTIYVSKEEKRAIIKAAFLAYFPKLLLVLCGFGLAIILIYFWLK